MAYKVMYRTYRPQTFDQVIGQKVVKKTLINAIKEDKISHAYLFCGPRGTGKTTLARIFAKSLNCLDRKDNVHLCNQCSSCVAINEGTHPDVIEIDAASNSGVDAVRELIEQVNYQPIMGKYKVYIIDEVHNMSNAAFNALLKTLEEPPLYCVFILCTTEPNKLLATILSRVQRFDFTKVSDAELIENMQNILKKEKVEYEANVLETIASLADGGVRDSLSLLDQVLSYVDKKITEKDINTLFGLLTYEQKIKYVELLSKYDLASLLSKLKEDYSKGMDILKLHDDLVRILSDYLIYSLTKEKNLLKLLKYETIKELPLSNSFVSSVLNYLISSRMEYRKVTSIYDHFEMTLINAINIAQNKVNTLTNSDPVVSKETTQVQQKPISFKFDQEESNQQTQVKFTEREKLATSIFPNDKVIQKEKEPVVQESLFTDVKSSISSSKVEKMDDTSLLFLMHTNSKNTASEYQDEIETLVNSSKARSNQEITDLLENVQVKLVSNNIVIFWSTMEMYVDQFNQTKDKVIKFINENLNLTIENAYAITYSKFSELKDKYITLKNQNKLSTLKLDDKYKQTQRKTSNSKQTTNNEVKAKEDDSSSSLAGDFLSMLKEEAK